MKSIIKMTLAALALAVLWGVWTWLFCRFYVPANHMAVVTAKMFGEPLPPGQILARKGQKGIQEDVLGEGRHFLNPIFYEVEIVPVLSIPPGKVGIVTSKMGDELPEGEFIADAGQKGIWTGVLSPGKYRLNPHGYHIEVADAISIPIGYAGVITALSGQQAPSGDFAGAGQKGVRSNVLQPGLYYVNPKEYKVDVLEIGVNQVSLLGRSGGEVITKGQLKSQNEVMQQLQSNVLQEQKRKRLDYLSESFRDLEQRVSSIHQGAGAPTEAQLHAQAKDLEALKREMLQGDSIATVGLSQFVEFPSRDGFQISLDMTVEFELLPREIAGIFSRYGDLPAVVDKIIMPQITSISRNKGSEYRANDFIVGEGREKFQNDLTRSLAERLKEKSIIVHNALIRHVAVPDQILDPIQQASIAIEQDLTNKERQNTAKKLAELNTQLSLIEQRREQVAEETKTIRAEIFADQERKIAEIHAEALKKVAEIKKHTAALHANKVRIISTAEADAVKLVDGEKANGLKLWANAFKDPQAFSMWELATGLDPKLDINILHSGEGTLWTDLENRSFSNLGSAKAIAK